MVTVFKCSVCGLISDKPLPPVCPECGGFVHPIHSLSKSIAFSVRSMWRYGESLPKFSSVISINEGYTPLVKSRRIFGNNVFFKDEGRNPTGSFRDRAASLIVSDAYSRGVKRLILASDGNMGVSVAAYAARAGLEATVYVPPWVDLEKIACMKAYGVNVIVKDSTLDELLLYVEGRAGREGFYNASSTYNALSIEGLKTISFELFEELGGVEEIYLPLGSGLTYLSIFHGFNELVELGLTTRIPRLIGVEYCGNPIYSQELHVNVKKCVEETLPGLSYRKPLVKELVLNVLEKYGEVIVVSRREVVDAAETLARREGVFVELSSVVALAGALKVEPRDGSVILLTGHGLKGASAYAKPGRRRLFTLLPGSTKNMIISILKDNPGLTGYEVWKKLGFKISVQAVYQHLHELEKMGYLETRINGGTKRYYLKSEGKP